MSATAEDLASEHENARNDLLVANNQTKRMHH